MKNTIASLTISLLLSTASVQAEVRLPSPELCLTFGQSTDLLEGEISPRRSRSGHFNLAMIEQTLDRATHGSLVLNNGVYRIGLTKNTNTATVAYQCDIAADTLNGQCSIMAFSAITSTATLLTDVGFLNFSACAETPASAAITTYSRPIGEDG